MSFRETEDLVAYLVGDFTVDLRRVGVWKNEESVLLEPKAFDVLRHLIRYRDRLVTQDELFHAVWKDVCVTSNALTRTISQIRKVFGDDANTPLVIRTVPKRGYRFIASVAAIRVPSQASAEMRTMVDIPEPSIAVLPFVNLSADKDDEYFSYGLAEEIRNALANVSNLKVIARTSSFFFKGKDEDARRIGAALGVRTILEGSVRHSGDRFRITSQLVDTQSGHHIWSERYDRKMTDVFALQDEISAEIVGTLLPKLSPQPSYVVSQAGNLEAFHAHLKSRYHFSKLSEKALTRSQAYSEQAIQLDPKYAPAYSGLAQCLFQTAIYGSKPANEILTHAKRSALQALALNEEEPAAHAVLARIAGEQDHDWVGALHHCHLALACRPLSSDVRVACAQFILWPLRQFDDVRANIQPALREDPLSPLPRFVLAQTLLTEGCRAQAIEDFKMMLDFEEHFWPPLVALGVAYTIDGRTADAIESSERGLANAPWNSFSVGLLAGNYAQSGEGAHARTVLDRLEAPASRDAKALGYAAFFLVAGDFPQAAHHFSQVIEAGFPLAGYYFTFMSLFEGFSKSPDARKLRASMRLPTMEA